MLLDGQGPLHGQVYRAIRGAIVAGDFAPGSRLPATRVVAAELGVSRTTVLAAYEQLVAEGYAAGRQGSGTYVPGEAAPAAAAPADRRPDRRGDRVSPPSTPFGPSGDAAGVPAPSLGALGEAMVADRRLPIQSGYVAVHRPPRFDFRYGMPALDDFPLETWQRCLGRAARRASRRSYDYGSPQGSPALREALATYLSQARGLRCRASQVLVTSGSQQALDLIARVLVDRGDRVVVEEPGYDGTRRAMLASGAELCPAPVDDEGIDAAVLPPSARLAVVTPTHQYPLGGVLSWPRRSALLSWARRAGAWIVEDDYDGEYRFDGPPIPPLQTLDDDGRVLYVGTFSKVMFPSLRVGYVVAPPAIVDALARMKLVADGGGAFLEQEALAEFLDSGAFARHVRRSRSRAADRRRTLVASLQRHLAGRAVVLGANAGLHVVLRLPGVPCAEARSLARRAADAGVGIYPITPYYLEPPRDAAFLLGYAAMPAADIDPGVARLAEALGLP